MALNFPANPEPGDQYAGSNGVTYTYDGVKWVGASVETGSGFPTASTTTAGVVKVDGTSITIANGVISSQGGGGGNPFNQSLNTTDDVTFDSVGTAAISVSQINGTNPGNELVIQANNHNWTFATDGGLTFPDGLTIDNSVIGYATSNTVSEEIPGGTISSTSIVENQIAIDSTNSIIISKVTTQINNDGVTTTTDSTGSRLEINNTGASIKRYIDPDGPNNAIYFQVRTDTSGAVLEGVEENIGYTTYGRVTASQGVVEVSTGTDSSNNVWQFGTDGNLTLPVGSDILDSTGTSVLHSGAELVGEGVTQVGSSLVIATDSGGGLTGWSSTAASIAYDANILSTYAVGSTITWQDGTTATLTQVDSYAPSSIDIFWNTPKTGTLFPITLKTANYIAAEPVTARITATGKQWTFNENGKLTLPAGTTYEYLNTPLTGHGDGLARLDFALVTDGVITEWMAASANPAGSGYSPGDTFTFDEAFLGIPGASVTIQVLTVGPGGTVENLAFTQPPLYPADIYRDSPINLQVGPESNRWTFGATGKLTTPGDIQLGAASYLRFSDSSFQGTAFVGDATRLYGNVNQDVDVIARPLSTVTATTTFDTDLYTGQFELSEPFDIYAVQAGWEMNTGTEQSPIWSRVSNASPNPGEYWIYLVADADFLFAPNTAYTFRNPTPVLRTWTFGTDGTLAVPGAIKQGISKLDLNADGSGNVYLTTTTDDTTALFMNTTGIQTFARESLSLYAGTTLSSLEAAYNNKVIELNAAFAAESWTGAGYPAGPTSSQALNAAKAMNPLIPDVWITIATELQTAYDTWQNALRDNSVSIGVGNSSWAFKPNGSFAINNNEVHIGTNNWGQIAFVNANTVVYTQKSNTNLASIRVHATIEGDEDGDTTGLHSQACDMMIVRRVSNGGVSTVDSVVYGVIYTGAGPLATLDAQWNAVTNKIEITATPVSTTTNVFVKIYATEVARGD